MDLSKRMANKEIWGWLLPYGAKLDEVVPNSVLKLQVMPTERGT